MGLAPRLGRFAFPVRPSGRGAWPRAAVLLAACWLLDGMTAMAGEPASWSARVIWVSDGDSLGLQPLAPSGAGAVRARLKALDAPERCQAHGEEAHQALRQRLLGGIVQARSWGQDVHGRWLVSLEHQGADVGGWLVGQGHAWSSWREKGRAPYGAAQGRARREGRGLFAASDPEPPWQFRRRHGPCPWPEGASAWP